MMQALYNHGDTSFRRIESWFGAFASAMTNKFRTEYGGFRWNASDELSQSLPLDVTQGIAWKSTVCVAMNWRWLLLS
jgi:hypothetical protein